MNACVKNITLAKEFKKRSTCAYNGGFHTIAKRMHNRIKMNLVCPSCHDEFDLNFTVNPTDKGDGN